MRPALLFALLTGCMDTGLEKVREDDPEGERVLEAYPLAIDFGLHADLTPISDTVTITSTGDEPATITGMRLVGATTYTISWPATGAPLEPGQSVDVVVTYTPASWHDEASLVVESDASGPSLVVALSGAGSFPAIEIDPTSLHFDSAFGEAVEADVVVSSVGTADLVLSDMYVEGARFSAVGDIPATLAPGEDTTLTVTYRPELPGETATGKLWLTTNTEQGFAVVPLTAGTAPTCIGVGEAWDRGLLTARTNRWGALELENLSADVEVCVDYWYVWRAIESQDMGAGDMDTDMGSDYPNGSLTMPIGGTLTFDYANSDESWWCMEETQYTQEYKDYTFTGAYVPEPLMSYMNAEDQEGSWAWQVDDAVIIAARGTNYAEVSTGGGGTARVQLKPFNMGGEDAQAELRETIPAGWTAGDFSWAPDAGYQNTDGSTTYVWDMSFEARIQQSPYVDTVYDVQEIGYTLTAPACEGRQYFPMMETRWEDSAGTVRMGYANPLVVNCL